MNDELKKGKVWRNYAKKKKRNNWERINWRNYAKNIWMNERVTKKGKCLTKLCKNKNHKYITKKEIIDETMQKKIWMKERLTKKGKCLTKLCKNKNINK